MSPGLKCVPAYIWGMLRSYLSDRSVHCEDQHRELHCGCPQGSVLGPVLWNILHDSVIRRMSVSVEDVVCYADDTLLIVGGDTAPEVEGRAAEALRLLSQLLAENGLELNTAKTEMLSFFPRWILDGSVDDPDARAPVVQVGAGVIERVVSIKYLGVILDAALNWDCHIRDVVDRCHRALPMFTQLCQNTCGYSNAARRTMVKGAIFSLLYYCSSVFYHRLQLRKNQRMLAQLQRKCDRLCIRGYRTISADAAAVLANSPPIDLLVTYRSLVYHVARGQVPPVFGPFKPILGVDPADPIPQEWKTTIQDEWEKRWKNSDAGSWTHELFPTVRCRQRTELRLNFWLTQALSGHGVFGSYLFALRRRPSQACRCGAPEETPSHVFRFCPLFEEGRPRVWRRPLSPELVQYLENVVLDLWRAENPGHRLNRG